MWQYTSLWDNKTLSVPAPERNIGLLPDYSLWLGTSVTPGRIYLIDALVLLMLTAGFRIARRLVTSSSTIEKRSECLMELVAMRGTVGS